MKRVSKSRVEEAISNIDDIVIRVNKVKDAEAGNKIVEEFTKRAVTNLRRARVALSDLLRIEK